MAKSEGWRKGTGHFHKELSPGEFKPAPSWDHVSGKLVDTTHRGDMTQTDKDEFKPDEPPVVRKSGLTDT